MTMYIEPLKNRANQLSSPDNWKPEPCSEQEISDLETVLNIRLPQAYKEFLRWIGKGSKDFLRSKIWVYRGLMIIQSEAKDLLLENQVTLRLKPTQFVFLMDQGYQFLFFDTEEGNNPMVYRYIEGTPEFIKEFCSFTEFLEFQIESHFMLLNNILITDVIELKKKYSPCTS